MVLRPWSASVQRPAESARGLPQVPMCVRQGGVLPSRPGPPAVNKGFTARRAARPRPVCWRRPRRQQPQHGADLLAGIREHRGAVACPTEKTCGASVGPASTSAHQQCRLRERSLTTSTCKGRLRV